MFIFTDNQKNRGGNTPFLKFFVKSKKKRYFIYLEDGDPWILHNKDWIVVSKTGKDAFRYTSYGLKTTLGLSASDMLRNKNLYKEITEQELALLF